ncbi:hypothetical protein [Mesorhizobium sp. KR9-304]|uniref:hypothetical protein n=1 Tax=Mesorhizobium sp. KR9-304 TaxID=3156614 RepID=UPI0032B61F87
MNRVLTYLGRFFIIIAGYSVASLAASAFLVVVVIASAGSAAEELPAMLAGSYIFVIPFVALFVAYFAFVPSAPAILLAEILGKRDWLFYAIAGGIVAVVVLGFFWRAADGMYEVSEGLDLVSQPAGRRSAITDSSLALLVVGAGMCGGIGYWLVAGRTAGSWRPRKDVTSPAP